MKSILRGIGIANPSHRFKQSQLLRFMTDAHQLSSIEATRLQKIYDVSGIDYRYSTIADFGLQSGSFQFFGNGDHLEPFPSTQQRSSAYEEHAAPLAVKAVNDLQKTVENFDLQTVTHLITVSCTGMYAPGLDIDLVEQLNLNHTVERICINFMGCYGAFNGLKTADYICRADPEAVVLILDVELCTLHFQRENTLENWLSNSLFSDGAAAVLVQGEAAGKGFYLESFYSTLAIHAKEEMGWRIGNTGYQMRLSSKIAKHIQQQIPAIQNSMLAKADLKSSDIQAFAIHPGGRRILEVCEESLNLPEESMQHSFDVLKEYGNMSSATILFVLKRFFNELQSGQRLTSYAFGPGLTVESMILQAV